ncbi:MAG: transglycosylase domain-containing protein [Deltaproteobacteria bacterium]|nr:transglycosylase domain-containing protein [Deltaproteobacteria bacterium]
MPGGGPGLRPRVVVGNPADGGVIYWVAKLSGFVALGLITSIAMSALCIYSYFSLNAPPVPDLRTYSKVAPAVSRIYAADGTLLGEFAKEWRRLVSFEDIPKTLVDAFLAVEDHDFYGHRGLYFKGIARAVWTNLTAGDFAQGGSTITQQVAKQFLGAEKSLGRKGKEAIMARRLEAQYSKQAILAVYLNHIYLGAGAWGVGGAAQRYFQKDVGQLTLAESALIAGLAKAPTKFSPIHQQKLAIERRDVVLDKMAAFGFATPEAVAAAKREPITLKLYRDVFPDRMPYYAEHVRRYISERYKRKAEDGTTSDGLYEQGLRIETAAEPTWEAAAYENTDFGARHQDKRQGWRGPEWRVDGAARDTFIARQKQLYGTAPLEKGKRYLAVVDKVTGDRAEVLIGDRRLELPLRNMRWAAPWQSGNAENDKQVDSANAVLKRGYVVWVSREVRTVERYRDWNLPDTKNPQWVYRDVQSDWDAAHAEVVRLEQVPHPQSTIFTADHQSGYVVTMVGGYDYDRSVFNRAVQACRQPGSTYKPIYYALGLDQGFGFDTVLNDVPVEIVDPDTGETWSPTNLGESMDGDVTLEYALVFSKNIPSVDLFQRLGAKNVEDWARRMGFSTKIFADDALALGASCSKLDEMARAFTLFARDGTWWPRPAGKEKSWVYVRRILDRSGNAVEDNTLVDDPQLGAADRFDRIAALAGITPPQAIPARTAYLMNRLLAHEVIYGFANVLRATQLYAAGKTGTSSATHDTSFIAYTSKFTTLVWMGDDKKERALGKSDAAYMTVVPLWARYMYEAAKGYPNPKIPWAVPPGVNPNDRGDHSKGKHGPQMDLIFRAPPKKDATVDNPDAPPV